MAVSFVVVDTDVFIWLSRGRDPAASYRRLLGAGSAVLSFATVAELWRGAHERSYSKRSRERLQADISSSVVVSPTDELTQRWAELTVDAKRRGHALGQPAQKHDAWIAATALLYEVPLLTADRDFAGYPGLVLLK